MFLYNISSPVKCVFEIQKNRSQELSMIEEKQTLMEFAFNSAQKQ